MNENRGDNNWLTEDQLLEGSKEFFRSNDYSNLEYNKTLDQGGRTFSSPIGATKTTAYNENQEIDMIITIFKSTIRQYDLGFFGLIESITLDILDNYDQTNLMLVTDSLSYIPIIKNEEISVAIEDI